MRTNGLIEVIIYVADMETQVRFYRDVFCLGLTQLSKIGRE
jgi:predicted enzyme related to lactoylglutathione lyase